MIFQLFLKKSEIPFFPFWQGPAIVSASMTEIVFFLLWQNSGIASFLFDRDMESFSPLYIRQRSVIGFFIFDRNQESQFSISNKFSSLTKIRNRLFPLWQRSEIAFFFLTEIRKHFLLWNESLVTAVSMHCTENLKHLFPEMKLRGLIPNFYISTFLHSLTEIRNRVFLLDRDQESLFTLKRILVTAVSRHCTENLKHLFPEMKLRGLIPNFYIHVSVSNLYIFPQSVLGRNRSQIHESGNWETEHNNYVLEITRPRSFISGNTHKSVPGICSRFSPALHLQCDVVNQNTHSRLLCIWDTFFL